MNTYKPSTDGCTEFSCLYHGEQNMQKAADYKAGREAYANGEQPSVVAGKSTAFDSGYWDEHADSYVESSNGIEDGYGDFYDMDAVSQGMYDDDPNPYHGDYAENDGY